MTPALLLLAAAVARADTVYLRNGNQMEGVVTAETKSTLTVDFGYGTTDLDKADVLKVVRTRRPDEQKEITRRHYESGVAVPEGDETLDKMFRVVLGKRRKALEARQRRAELDEEERSLREGLPGDRARYEEANRALASADPRSDPGRYNELIGDINSAAASARADESRLKSIEPEQREADAVVNDYMSSYRALDEYLRGEGAALLAHKSDYTDWLRGELKDMAGDFRREAVAAASDGANGVFVTVRLNGKISGRFLVDTGASTTMLYKEIADKLAVPQEAVVGRGEAKVADGRSVQATEVRLDSLSVGKAEVRGSPAIIVPIGGQGFDGLLGMTFLGRFVSRVDLPNKRLILEDLK
jgi:clan AA aspartic protease (TIGR02281 family)